MSNVFNAPFPQANDFEKVIKIINVPESDKLRDYKYMKQYLNVVSDRQVDYYVSACVYLALVNKNKELTELGIEVRSKTGIAQIIELSRTVVSDEVFGYVFFLQKFKGKELEKEEIIDIMHSKMHFQSEAMYIRRASTITSWIRWINSQEMNSGVVWDKEELDKEEYSEEDDSIWEDMMIGDFVEEELD